MRQGSEALGGFTQVSRLHDGYQFRFLLRDLHKRFDTRRQPCFDVHRRQGMPGGDFDKTFHQGIQIRGAGPHQLGKLCDDRRCADERFQQWLVQCLVQGIIRDQGLPGQPGNSVPGLVGSVSRLDLHSISCPVLAGCCW
jgi:hypothetical protein